MKLLLAGILLLIAMPSFAEDKVCNAYLDIQLDKQDLDEYYAFTIVTHKGVDSEEIITLSSRQVKGLDPVKVKPGTNAFGFTNLRMLQKQQVARMDFSLSGVSGNGSFHSGIELSPFDFKGVEGLIFNIYSCKD